jgi:hypothetical protein
LEAQQALLQEALRHRLKYLVQRQVALFLARIVAHLLLRCDAQVQQQ